MARPRDTIFYEIPLPQTPPEKEKWLPDYHKYSEMLIRYLVDRGAQSTAYHTAIRCLTVLREYLIDTGMNSSVRLIVMFPVQSTVGTIGWLTSILLCSGFTTAVA